MKNEGVPLTPWRAPLRKSSRIHVSQADLIVKRLNIHGFWMYYEEYLPKIRPALAEATNVVASGKLSLPFTQIYKPPQIKEAIEHAERGGKILLDFNHTN